MVVQVLFFGATAAITGKRKQSIEMSDNEPARKVFERMLAAYPSLASHKLHFSVNQQFASGDEIIRDGDELAIFTAVSGG
jgi:molybdopterin converting factor small subunit